MSTVGFVDVKQIVTKFGVGYFRFCSCGNCLNPCFDPKDCETHLPFLSANYIDR